jgi:eukaryotic-like serine/threonine-protein kinase
LQGRLLGFIRWVFKLVLILAAGFLSCLTAMRIAIRGNEVMVPNLTGRTVLEASNLLTPIQLQMKIDGYRFDPKISADRILSQAPSPESRLKVNRHIRVVVSLGEKKVAIPDLRGDTLRAAQITLLKRGLTVGGSAQFNSEIYEAERIISQEPLPQDQSIQSPVVNLLISSGKVERVYLMPDLTGLEFGEISRMINGLGLRLGKVAFQPVSGIGRGVILHQNPPAGSRLRDAEEIGLEVAR